MQFLIFKYFYPYAGFINGDSYTYLLAAFWNQPVSFYPIGYPKFLRLFSVFSNSDTALVAFQYLLMQVSSLFLIATILYNFNCSRFTKTLLFIFAVLNPVNLYIANYISSDAIFISLSLIWFTLLIWTVLMPSVRLIILQVLVIFLAFSVRYNALYYPVISIAVISLSRQKPIHKFTGILAIVLMLAFSIWNTTQQLFELTGIRQFSPFSGWQIANNALNGYRYVKSVDRKPVPKQFAGLDGITRRYFDSTNKNALNSFPDRQFATTYYMWVPASPLQQYMFKTFHTHDSALDLKRWASMGPLYSAYGSFLIRKYPFNYIRDYLAPNFLLFFAPPLEFLETYNMGRDTVHVIAKTWFHYKSNKVSTHAGDFNVELLSFYPTLLACINVLFLASFLCFIMLRGLTNNKQLAKILWIVTSFWGINFCFSVLSAPIYARYQVFPTLVSFVFASLMIEHVYIAAFKPSKLSNETYESNPTYA